MFGYGDILTDFVSVMITYLQMEQKYAYECDISVL